MKRVLTLGAGFSYGHGVSKPRPALAHGFFSCDTADSLKVEYSALLRYPDDYLPTYGKNLNPAPL